MHIWRFTRSTSPHSKPIYSRLARAPGARTSSACCQAASAVRPIRARWVRQTGNDRRPRRCGVSRHQPENLGRPGHVYLPAGCFSDVDCDAPRVRDSCQRGCYGRDAFEQFSIVPGGSASRSIQAVVDLLRAFRSAASEDGSSGNDAPDDRPSALSSTSSTATPPWRSLLASCRTSMGTSAAWIRSARTPSSSARANRSPSSGRAADVGPAAAAGARLRRIRRGACPT
jgi:hypothetical protein